jgi:hypothetical protein
VEGVGVEEVKGLWFGSSGLKVARVAGFDACGVFAVGEAVWEEMWVPEFGKGVCGAKVLELSVVLWL